MTLPPAGEAERPAAPLGRRALRITDVAAHGAYVVLSAADPEGPAPLPGQFYMLTAQDRWGGGDGERPLVPRAFSVLRAHAGPPLGLDFIL